MGAIRKFIAASGPSRQTFIAAAFAVVLVRTCLWLLPFTTLMRLIDRLSRPSRFGVHRDSATRDVAAAVQAISRRVPVATCLTQALSMNMLLARRGEPCEIKIGIARTATGELKSHAWVVQEANVILGDNGALDGYTTLTSFEGVGNLLGRG